MQTPKTPKRESSDAVAVAASAVGACAIVGVWLAMGGSWLAGTVFGVPMGVWAIGIVVGGVWVSGRPSGLVRETRGGVVSSLAFGLSPIWRALMELSWPVWALRRRIAGQRATRDAWREAATAWLDRAGWPERALVATDERSGFAGSMGPARSRRPLSSPADAVLRTDARGPSAVPAVGRGAKAEHDWRTPTAVRFESIFPHRVPVGPTPLTGADAGIVEALASVAARFGRSGSVGLLSRLDGRRCVDLSPGMSALRTELERVGPNCPSPATRAAGRMLSAWAVQHDGAWPLDARLDTARLAVDHTAGEIVPRCRHAALLLATGDDEEAIDSLLDIAGVLRSGLVRSGRAPILPEVLESEIVLGLDDTMTIGRVAVGVTLAMSLAREDGTEFLADDIAEDLDRAGWLIGADHDRMTLLRLVRLLAGEGTACERTHHAEFEAPTLWDAADGPLTALQAA